MQTALLPRHPFKEGGWVATRPVPRRSLAPIADRPGDWHYAGLPRRRLSWVAVLVSLSVHGALLWGGGPRKIRAPEVVARPEPVIQMVMPDLKEEEEEPVEELAEMDEAPGIEVPRLVDLPSAVTIDSFVQPLEMNVALQSSVDASKLTNIPLRIAPAGQRGAGMKNLFDLSQLDRIPEPIAQPPPQFPHSLKQTVDRAEVVVDFIVDTKGEVRDALASASTHTGFEQAAVEGVRKWRFRAGTKDGRKVNTRMRVSIQFSVLEG